MKRGKSLLCISDQDNGNSLSDVVLLFIDLRRHVASFYVRLSFNWDMTFTLESVSLLDSESFSPKTQPSVVTGTTPKSKEIDTMTRTAISSSHKDRTDQNKYHF